MAGIELNEQEANILLEALNVALKNIGAGFARPYAFFEDKIKAAFAPVQKEVEEVKPQEEVTK
jgi:hypothetical protein